MKLPVFAIIMSVILVASGCSKMISSENVTKNEITETLEKHDLLQNSEPGLTLEEMWEEMVFEKGGCLLGQQDFHNNVPIEGDPVFSREDWERFSSGEKRELTAFLISKFDDSKETSIHTCPFFKTTNGEMAVYALQHIQKKNWYELTEFKTYAHRKSTGSNDQPQVWLQEILKKKDSRQKLIDAYLNELNN